jgi:protein-disulfide isomerase
MVVSARTNAQPTGPISVAVENIEDKSLTVSLRDVPTVIRPGAKIAVIEFSDFQCPYCARFALDTLPEIKSEFVDTGQAAYAFMHFPIEQIHKLAFKAAGASTCAGKQGKFWDMHDLLFANQKALGQDALLENARNLRLNDAKFQNCLEGVADTIKRDQNEARRLGINSTPTFLIGPLDSDNKVSIRRRISGAQPLSVFRDAIQELLSSNLD